MNRIGSLRSQTQFSDISSEKRSPKTTIKLPIKQNSTKNTIKSTAQIKSNGLTFNDVNNNEIESHQNGNVKKIFNNQSLSGNRSSSSNLNEYQLDQLNHDRLDRKNDKQINKIDDDANKVISTELDQKNENNGNRYFDAEKKSIIRDKFNFSTNFRTKSITKRPNKKDEIEFPKLEKLIRNELKMISEISKQTNDIKLTRCNTDSKINDRSLANSSSEIKSKRKQNSKLISSDTIG